MRIVITGALGHIGSALIRNPRLAAATSQLILVDNLSTQRFASIFDLPNTTRYAFVSGDVEAVVDAALLNGVSAVIHLAANTDPGAAVRDPDAVFRNNLRITRHLAATCREVGVPLVFVSSTSVYAGNTPVVDESSPTGHPSSPYAQCKLQEEDFIQDQGDLGLPFITFRFGTIFGVSPGMRFHTAVNRFCWQAATGSPIEVWSTAMDQVRPYLAVTDAVETITTAAVDRVFDGRTLNAVSCNVSVRDVLQAIRDAGVSPHVSIVDSPLMTDTSFGASTALAEGYGFRFRASLGDGVRKTLALLGNLSGG